jgi:peptide subunit release factor 1 (eRF1)
VTHPTIALPAPTSSTADLTRLLERLTTIPPRTYTILSCYLRLEPRDRTRSAYGIEFRTRRQALADDPVRLALDRERRAEVERDLDRIAAYLEDPSRLPHARGLAIFACEALDLFAAVAMFRVHRTRLILDDTPWIAELAASGREVEPILAVVIDRAHARFFTVNAAGAEELPGLAESSTRGGKYHSSRHGSPGWGERDYHGRLAEERHRHYARVVAHVEELYHGRTFRGLALAGPSDQTDGLVRFLPEQWSARVLGAAKLNPTAVSPADVQAAALDAAEAHDRSELTAALKDLNEAYGSGWATDGPRETLGALHRGQARTLFIREELAGAGYRCSMSGRLVLTQSECRNDGAAEPVRDIVDEAIEEALAQGIRVRFVPDLPGADVVDGMAATLRFR